MGPIHAVDRRPEIAFGTLWTRNPPGNARLATKRPGVVIQALRRVNATDCALLMSKAIVAAPARGLPGNGCSRMQMRRPWAWWGSRLARSGSRYGRAALRYLATKGARATVEHIAAELGPDVSKRSPNAVDRCANGLHA